MGGQDLSDNYGRHLSVPDDALGRAEEALGDISHTMGRLVAGLLEEARLHAELREREATGPRGQTQLPGEAADSPLQQAPPFGGQAGAGVFGGGSGYDGNKGRIGHPESSCRDCSRLFQANLDLTRLLSAADAAVASSGSARVARQASVRVS